MARLLGIAAAGLIAMLLVGAAAIHGIGGIGGIGGLGVAARIEAGLQRAAARALAASGPPWAAVAVRGRDAILTGTALLPAERREGAGAAARAIDAIPGIREVRDNTTARFASLAAIETALAARCQQAIARLGLTWMSCAVTGRTVTLSGATATEAGRRMAVDRVFSAVEQLNAREHVRDATGAHYRSSEAMRAAFDRACTAVLAGFVLNWMTCAVQDRRFILGGAAPVEAEWRGRVAVARRALAAVRGAAGVTDETRLLPPLASAAACRAAFDRLTGGGPIRPVRGPSGFAPASRALLTALARVAKRCVGVKIEVRGHSERSGDAGDDLRRSEALAAAVAGYLTGLGVPAGRVSARGFGSARPLAANDTANDTGSDTAGGRAANRRIEFALSQ